MCMSRWLLLACIAVVEVTSAQDYPVKPMRLIVPYPAGGPVDAVARLLVQQFTLGQTVVVESRSGAGGSLGAEVVAKAPADGYTMLIGNSGPMTINPVLRSDLSYDPKRDFAAVTWLTSGQLVLVVHPSLPVRSVKELVALARARPGALNYGSAGIGNTTHLGMELLQVMAKVKLNHVPYKGVAPAFIDLMSGQIAVMFGNITGPLAHIQAGRLRALAVTSAKRAPVLPELPTMGEFYPGFELVTWMGIFLPAGSPEVARVRLQDEFIRILQTKEMRERLIALGNDVIAGRGEDLAGLLDRELKLYAGIIKSAGITAQ